VGFRRAAILVAMLVLLTAALLMAATSAQALVIPRAPDGLDGQSLRGLTVESQGRAPIPTPRIAKITPSKASSGTGSKVTITGTGFGRRLPGARVRFGMSSKVGTNASAISSWSDKRIVCVVPPEIWSGELKVRNSWGRSSNGVPFEVTFLWGKRRLAADARTYRIHANSSDGDFTALVKAAIASWNAAGADFELVPEGGGTCTTTAYAKDGHNDIFWSTAIPRGAGSGTVARASRWPVGATTSEFDIWLNDNARWGDGSPGSGTFDVQSVLLHELGHVIEFGDLRGAADRGKVMYGGLDPGTQRRTLGAGEIAGIQWIYGKKSAMTGSIAFVRDGDIWTIEPDGSRARQLTSGGSYDSAPAWAPDRKTIAFVRQPGFWEGVPGIYTIPSSGGPATALQYMDPADPDSTRRMITDLAYSPDGLKLAFAEWEAHGYVDQLIRVNVVDLRMNATQVLVERSFVTDRAWSLSWSPDGTTLLVAQTGQSYEDGPTWLLRLADRRSTDIGIAEAGGADWSPDGQTIVISTRSYGDSSILIARPNGSVIRTLVTRSGQNGSPTPAVYGARYSSDGGRVVYSLESDFDPRALWVVGADGTGQHRLTEGYEPAWR
jgi:Tol biopolymer transport system component